MSTLDIIDAGNAAEKLLSDPTFTGLLSGFSTEAMTRIIRSAPADTASRELEYHRIRLIEEMAEDLKSRMEMRDAVVRAAEGPEDWEEYPDDNN